MDTFHAKAIVEKNGKLLLNHVPFPEGKAVHVFVSATKPATQISLKGSVLKYEKPFAPVSEEDWEALK